MSDYRIIVRPLPSDVPETIRVRQGLKAMLRRLQLRVVDIVELDASNAREPQGDEPTIEPAKRKKRQRAAGAD